MTSFATTRLSLSHIPALSPFAVAIIAGARIECWSFQTFSTDFVTSDTFAIHMSPLNYRKYAGVSPFRPEVSQGEKVLPILGDISGCHQKSLRRATVWEPRSSGFWQYPHSLSRTFFLPPELQLRGKLLLCLRSRCKQTWNALGQIGHLTCDIIIVIVIMTMMMTAIFLLG